jgi:putative Holliday junction resolvase
MALDIGDNTIGVAVSDPLNLTAQGVKTIRRISYKKDFQELDDIITTYQVDVIVVGLPKKLDGTIGIQAEKVQQYVKKMRYRYEQEIIFQDERMTTTMAERMLIDGNVSRAKRKEVIDKLAAVNILTTFLDKNRTGASHE